MQTLTLLILYLTEFKVELKTLLEPITQNRTCLKSDFEQLLRKLNILRATDLDTTLFQLDSSRLLVDKIAYYVETLAKNDELFNTGINLLDHQAN